MRFQRFLAAGALLAAAAHAQVHESRAGDYVLRSNVTRTTAISEEAARAHGIEPGPGRGLLDVVVLKQGNGARQPVEAQVQVHAINLAGMQREIPMRQARAPNGDISYVGTFDFASREVLDFRVHAAPKAAPAQALALQYRDRMPAH